MIFVNPFFVNPFTIWANLALKSGEAMLEAAGAAIARPEVAHQPATPPTVVEMHDADAQPPKAKARPKAKVHSKAKGKKRRTKR